MIGREYTLEPVDADRGSHRHNAGVVDQAIDRRGCRVNLGRCPSDAGKRRKIALDDVEPSVSRVGHDLFAHCDAGCDVTHQHHNAPTGARHLARRHTPDAMCRSGDDYGPTHFGSPLREPGYARVDTTRRGHSLRDWSASATWT